MEGKQDGQTQSKSLFHFSSSLIQKQAVDYITRQKGDFLPEVTPFYMQRLIFV